MLEPRDCDVPVVEEDRGEVPVYRAKGFRLTVRVVLPPPPIEEPAPPTLERPRTRAGCADVPRPCPFVSCAHHLYLDVSQRTGRLTLNRPELEPHELEPGASCALDVAEHGGASLDEIAAAMGVSRERIRQIEVRAMARAALLLRTMGVQSPEDLAADRSESPSAVAVRRLPIVS